MPNRNFFVTLSVVIFSLSIELSDSSGTCFLSSYQLPSSSPPFDLNSNLGHPSQFFGQNDAQQKITDRQPPPTKGGSAQVRPSVDGLRGINPTIGSFETTSSTASPFPPPRRVNYLRPASRTGGTRPLQSPPSPSAEPPYINAEELETIALFEAALERSQKDFGSRINSIDSRFSQFSTSVHGQTGRARAPLPKSPPRRRPTQEQFNPPINHGTNFFNLDFNDFSQEKIATVDRDYDFNRGISQERVTDQQTRIEIPPATTARPTTTTTQSYPIPSNRGKTSQNEKSFNRGIKGSSVSTFDSRLDSRSSLQNQPPTTRFMSWLEKAKMLRNMQIAPGVNFTVLLPSDSAIQLLPTRFTNDLTSNMTKLREVLFYHIIPLSIEMINLEDGQTLPTLYSKKIRVTRSTSEQQVSMSGSKILNERTDMMLNDGKVRFFNVDKVLFPPKGSLYSIISSTPDLSIFGKLIDETDLRSELAFNGPFTMFAPSNEAFNKLDSEAMTFLTSDPKNSKDFVLRHISKPVVFAANIPPTATVPVETAFGEKINFARVTDDLVKVDGVAVTFADIFATNGVLHVLDQVL